MAIHPDQATRLWLAQLNPPAFVNEYFHRIAMQQKTIAENCGQ